MDVVCTSGPGTGKEAQVEKLIAMREGLGADAAMALASGVTAENVERFLPYADAYLVGTGIEARFGVLDPTRSGACISSSALRLARLVARASSPEGGWRDLNWLNRQSRRQ